MKRYFLSITALLWVAILSAQAPQLLNYQGVARSVSGAPLANQTIGIRLNLQNAGAIPFYVESHQITTNAQGLYALHIGQGTVWSGVFSEIPWSDNGVWLQVEIDPDGGANYQPAGPPAPLASVPYALESLHAAHIDLSGDVEGDAVAARVVALQANPLSAEPPSVGDVLKWNGAQWQPATDATSGGAALSAGAGIQISGNIVENTGDLDPYNELQTLELTGDQLSLTPSGGTITLPSGGLTLPYSGTGALFNAPVFHVSNTEAFGSSILGESTSNVGGNGVFGAALAGHALHGESQDGYGIYAVSQNFHAGLVHSTNNVGLLAFSDTRHAIQTYGRIWVQEGNDGTPGVMFSTGITGDLRGFVGLRDDNEMGLYGYGMGDWIMRFNVNSGTICANQAITICSDRRLKHQFLPLENSLQRLAKLNGYHYHWLNERQTGLQTGLVAQEVRESFPELVHTDQNGMLSVDYTGLIPHLIEANKTLKMKLDEQEQRIARLEALLHTYSKTPE